MLAEGMHVSCKLLLRHTGVQTGRVTLRSEHGLDLRTLDRVQEPVGWLRLELVCHADGIGLQFYMAQAKR